MNESGIFTPAARAPRSPKALYTNYFQQLMAPILEREQSLKNFSKVANAMKADSLITTLRNETGIEQAISAFRELAPAHQL
ncbi:MAG: hypothetical protein C0473_03980 [Cyanobacteria bacterium DS3.002]|nr:hypothetical protein [Cyanobacteria bacterium DS3.002]MBA4050066.1 hypothetical protein [Cyanobacteria bacterium DS2.008]